MIRINVALEMFAFSIMVVVLVGCIITIHVTGTTIKSILPLAVADTIYTASSTGEWLFSKESGFYNHFVYMTLCLINDISFYVLLILFMYFVLELIQKYAEPRSMVRITPFICIPVCIVSCVLWIISTVNDMFSSFTDSGIVVTPLIIFGEVGGYICIVLYFILIIQHAKQLGVRITITLLLFIIFPVMTIPIYEIIKDRSISLMPLMFTLSIVVIYTFLSLRQSIYIQQQETELINGKIELLLSQIKPHFIYNSLNTIYHLCDMDPALAQKAISSFSEFLRANTESLNSNIIPVQKELEHVKHYLSLEKIRFQDKLQIHTDIKARDFEVPSFILQPIVENAVKHGILPGSVQGNIWISIYEKNEFFEITVRDDGVGFDTESVFEDEEGSKTHIGMTNVKERLKFISRASMHIYSAPGKGTTVIIQIPKSQPDAGGVDKDIQRL